MAEIIQEKMSIYEKLQILTDAAKYDVACTSSGVERKGDGTGIGNCSKAGICHSFSTDGRCISLLKILFTNECIYDCKYCVNRSSNDVIRTSFTPDEISAKISELVRPKGIEWQGEVEIIFQTIENLHAAVPNHTGDWYFTGKYPTPGGYRVVNQAYINYFEQSEGRSY